MYALQTNDDKQMMPDTNQDAEELTVSNAVVSPTALGERRTHCLVSIKTKSVLVTFDGSDPVTATLTGHVFAAGNYWWHRHMVNAAKFIEAASSEAATVRFQPMACA